MINEVGRISATYYCHAEVRSFSCGEETRCKSRQQIVFDVIKIEFDDRVSLHRHRADLSSRGSRLNIDGGNYKRGYLFEYRIHERVCRLSSIDRLSAFGKPIAQRGY